MQKKRTSNISSSGTLLPSARARVLVVERGCGRGGSNAIMSPAWVGSSRALGVRGTNNIQEREVLAPLDFRWAQANTYSACEASSRAGSGSIPGRMGRSLRARFLCIAAVPTGAR